MERVDQFKATFFQECEELLGKLEHHLAALTQGAGDAEQLNAAFRAIHSIKGGAGMFGFTRLVAFSHALESVLDRMRKSEVQPHDDLVLKVLSATDTLSDLVHAARTGDILAAGFESDILEQLLSVSNIESSVTTAAPASRVPRKNDSNQGAICRFHVVFEPSEDMFRRGIEPLRIIRSLKELGTVSIKADTSRLPEFSVVDPGCAYLAWIFEIETRKGLKAVREIFEFAEGSCKLDITLVSQQSDAGADVPNIDVHSSLNAGSPATHDAGASVRADAHEASPQQPPALPFSDRRVTSIRVDLERVDRLVNLVGEIAISQAMVLQQIDQSIVDANPHLFRDLTQLLQHTRNLQDSVMAIRAQPVRSIFSRMPRVVREVTQQTGKKVVLEMSGEETEIDKTIIEELSDPLVHIIRNSIDHGIETIEERLAAGKPSHGTIRLFAAQRGSRIIIQVTDDGRGIDRESVRRKAIENNLIMANAEMTDEELDNLIFLPGLSTAGRISSISGRGVGMDVVYSNIQRLGGRVNVRSEAGRGTTVTLTLPLTLAVLEGMVIRSGGSCYLIPLSNIVECIVTPRHSLKIIPSFGPVINVRGRQVRVVHLGTTLGAGAGQTSSQIQIILVEIENGATAGLIVDEIIGQQQVVVKSVRENFGELAGVAGATILGDGGVALILDVNTLCELPSSRGHGIGADIAKLSRPGVQAA